MADLAVLGQQAGFALRWLHVVTAIASIGSSFYFIALDLGLLRDPRPPSGADSEEWQVHGGGFYHIQQYLVAPDRLPGRLTWFKWEACSTWLTGFALMAVVYYLGAELYLIDRGVRDLSVPQAVAISMASLALGWGVCDRLCRSPLGQRPTLLMLVLFALRMAMAWGYAQPFSRAARRC